MTISPRPASALETYHPDYLDSVIERVPLLVRAALRHPGPRPPVWFMRQAGRSLPEYRRVRGEGSMLRACRNPEMVAEITMQPVRRHGVDAAIFFSDIVVPVSAVGIDIDIVPGTGPVVTDPFTKWSDLDRLEPLTREHIPDIDEAVRLTISQLGTTPLIGFAGAPFTLASYLIEGGPSKTHARTKALMHGDPDLWHQLAARLAQISAAFLEVQITAGAQMVQLFDSWAGALCRADYERFVQPHSAAVLDHVHELGVPAIHFGVGTAELLGSMANAGSDVVGVDFRTNLAEASTRLGNRYAVQGNLDPALLSAPWPVIENEVRRIITEGRSTPGHIFNLGHGVPADTDPDVLTRIVALIKSCTDTPNS
ncbi:Uroporphyrinogen decarboxylase [Dermatophilus congolensis]|uniref:Uroporphyrinogen decarboxylase n=1 Tax=Dermatophilus congolensis TaxID=1863 RepID=A0AA46H0A2_9MICO|nr:Uroporphyrinogen decarboxylase [Dermatophilus congolensis]